MDRVSILKSNCSSSKSHDAHKTIVTSKLVPRLCHGEGASVNGTPPICNGSLVCLYSPQRYRFMRWILNILHDPKHLNPW